MLINLSNHPSAQWSEKQLEVAKLQYGEIIDMQFPQIPPEEGEDYIIEIAQKFFYQIEEYHKGNKDICIHIMGELTFCFCLVSLLKKYNIMCVASTTKRNVVQQENVKTTVFEFCKFREYVVPR